MKKILLALITSIVTLGIQAAPATTTSAITPAPVTSSAASQAYPSVPPPPAIDAKGYVLMDANSGQILAQQNASSRLEPASLTKMMSMYVISSTLKTGRIKLSDNVPISKEAWKTGGSRMFVQVGTQVPVQELINGIVVASGNDAAVAMAEYIGGTEEGFVDIMNQSAAKLGMTNSHFMDVNGLPAADHYSCPVDLAVLARSLIEDFPEYYPWYSQKWMQYGKIKQPNRNQLLWQDPTVDGLKTGHTDGAGYCLVASAKRNDIRLISVVMGATSAKARASATEALLNWGFRNFSSHQLYPAGQALAEPRVWYGAQKTVPLGLNRALTVTIPSNQYQNLKAFLTIDSHLQAPIKQGQQYGKVDVMLGNQMLFSAPVVALQNDPTGNGIIQLRDKVISMFNKS